MRKTSILTIAILAALNASASGQVPASQEETISLISEKLAAINEPFMQAYSGQPIPTESVVENLINNSIQRVLELREQLSGNLYVRLNSFAVGIPSGVSVEFTFPPE